jgi:hypothetical protein
MPSPVNDFTARAHAFMRITGELKAATQRQADATAAFHARAKTRHDRIIDDLRALADALGYDLVPQTPPEAPSPTPKAVDESPR